MPRPLVALLLLGGVLAFVLTSCPSSRDGMSGQLNNAKEETQSAVRSAVVALDLRAHDRSTRNLTAVQLTDARDEVLKAYGTVAALRADHADDLGHQGPLLQLMTAAVETLDDANAAIRAVGGPPDPPALHQRLMAIADALDRET